MQISRFALEPPVSFVERYKPVAFGKRSERTISKPKLSVLVAGLGKRSPKSDEVNGKLRRHESSDRFAVLAACVFGFRFRNKPSCSRLWRLYLHLT